MHIYLDHAATTPLPSTVKEHLIALLDIYGNPSSLHSLGEQAGRILSSARETTARFINASPEHLYFTSGGSAANTLAVKGYYAARHCRILYSPIAHKSLLSCVKKHPYSTPLRVDHSGFLVLSDLEKQLSTGKFSVGNFSGGTLSPFVVIDYANSEIGTIQDVRAIIDLVHAYQGHIFLDCTGSISTIPVDVRDLDVDMLAFSAHKLGGLKGCGVLYKKPEIELEPLIYGSQEQGLFGGTENVLGIASLEAALRQHDYASVSSRNRDLVRDYVLRHIPGSYLVGSMDKRLAHNLCLCFPGIEGEALLILLDMKGIQVSTGSACNSHSLAPSAVLTAIGIEETDLHSCIRLSFSGKETKEELDCVCETLRTCVNRLSELGRKAR